MIRYYMLIISLAHIHNGIEEVACSCSYFYKGLCPFHPRCFDRLRRLTPDTSPGNYPWYFTRVHRLRIHGLGSGFVTVLWESARQLFQASTLVQTCYLSRYFLALLLGWYQSIFRLFYNILLACTIVALSWEQVPSTTCSTLAVLWTYIVRKHGEHIF